MIYVNKYEDNLFHCDTENFYATSYYWSKWKWYVDHIDMNMAKVTKRNGYFVFKWKYKCDKYKVYFGRGVDLNYYKKFHIVNYYRTPEFFVKSIKRLLKDKIFDIRLYWQ